MSYAGDEDDDLGFIPFDEDQFRAEHTSDVVFYLLDEEDDMPRPEKFEWEEGPGHIPLMCGCEVPIDNGDTLWCFVDDFGTTPIAIDPVTIH